MDLECVEVEYLSMVQEHKAKGSEGFSVLLDHTLQEEIIHKLEKTILPLSVSATWIMYLTKNACGFEVFGR